MSLLSLSGDFAYFDGTEYVSYQRRAPGGTLTATVSNVRALRRVLTASPSPSNSLDKSIPEEAEWHLDASTLSYSPKRGDHIVSTTYGTYEVLQDSAETLANRYRVRTVKRG